MSINKKFICTKCSTPYSIEATPDILHTMPVTNKPERITDLIESNYKCKNTECGYENKLYWLTAKDYLNL
ncbi:MAG: hypothetical protein ACPKPY_04845 [Nitrososphaeraceae archaeon]